jgi:hypothetical protein
MNPWIGRITALVTLLFVYGAGYAGGRDQCLLHYQRLLIHHHK